MFIWKWKLKILSDGQNLEHALHTNSIFNTQLNPLMWCQFSLEMAFNEFPYIRMFWNLHSSCFCNTTFDWLKFENQSNFNWKFCEYEFVHLKKDSDLIFHEYGLDRMK